MTDERNNHLYCKDFRKGMMKPSINLNKEEERASGRQGRRQELALR
jgi:hypothetical protein